MQPVKVLVVGLPESCKTTFLAALWHLVSDAEAKTRLRLRQLGAGDYAHLNRLAHAWRRAEKQERTKVSAGLQRIAMLLADGSGREIELHFPDISGEHFENAWSQRALPADLAGFIREAQAILLFINPARIRAPVSVEQLRDQQAALGEPATSIEAEQPWQPKYSPTQVVLVDLLQALDALHVAGPIKLSVIISAWDTIEADWPNAAEFVSHELPLLHQYLAARAIRTGCRFDAYAVSAQGGTLPDDRNELLAEEIASHRIKIVDSSGKHHDLTVVVADMLPQPGEASAS